MWNFLTGVHPAWQKQIHFVIKWTARENCFGTKLERFWGPVFVSHVTLSALIHKRGGKKWLALTTTGARKLMLKISKMARHNRLGSFFSAIVYCDKNMCVRTAQGNSIRKFLMHIFLLLYRYIFWPTDRRGGGWAAGSFDDFYWFRNSLKVAKTR